LNYLVCKVAKKREQNKINSFIFYAECSNFAILMAKLRKNEKCKLHFAAKSAYILPHNATRFAA